MATSSWARSCRHCISLGSGHAARPAAEDAVARGRPPEVVDVDRARRQAGVVGGAERGPQAVEGPDRTRLRDGLDRQEGVAGRRPSDRPHLRHVDGRRCWRAGAAGPRAPPGARGTVGSRADEWRYQRNRHAWVTSCVSQASRPYTLITSGSPAVVLGQHRPHPGRLELRGSEVDGHRRRGRARRAATSRRLGRPPGDPKMRWTAAAAMAPRMSAAIVPPTVASCV